MDCSTQCVLNGLRYTFQEINEITYADAFNTCASVAGGSIALADTTAIRSHLYECCRNDQEYWVAFNSGDLTAKTDGNCPLFKARAQNTQITSTCNSQRKYVCQVPLATAAPSTTLVATQSNNTSHLANPSSALGAPQINVGLIIGAVFAVVLLLLLLVALYHYRLRHLNTKKFSKDGFKKCALNCTGLGASSSNEAQKTDQPATQEDHGYYSIRVHEDRSGSTSVYSYIADPANPRSVAQTQDQRTQQANTKAPSHPPPVPAENTTHYETIDDEPPQQTKAPRVIPPPPTVDPPPTPGQELEGSGVTYTTLIVPEEEQGVSYTTITRVLGDPPADPYAVVHKNSVGSRK